LSVCLASSITSKHLIAGMSLCMAKGISLESVPKFELTHSPDTLRGADDDDEAHAAIEWDTQKFQFGEKLFCGVACVNPHIEVLHAGVPTFYHQILREAIGVHVVVVRKPRTRFAGAPVAQHAQLLYAPFLSQACCIAHIALTPAHRTRARQATATVLRGKAARRVLCIVGLMEHHHRSSSI
jgi:hypothetical protein